MSQIYQKSTKPEVNRPTQPQTKPETNHQHSHSNQHTKMDVNNMFGTNIAK